MKIVLNYLFENYHMSLFTVTNIFALFNLKMTYRINRSSLALASGDLDDELHLKIIDITVVEGGWCIDMW